MKLLSKDRQDIQHSYLLHNLYSALRLAWTTLKICWHVEDDYKGTKSSNRLKFWLLNSAESP